LARACLVEHGLHVCGRELDCLQRRQRGEALCAHVQRCGGGASEVAPRRARRSAAHLVCAAAAARRRRRGARTAAPRCAAGACRGGEPVRSAGEPRQTKAGEAGSCGGPAPRSRAQKRRPSARRTCDCAARAGDARPDGPAPSERRSANADGKAEAKSADMAHARLRDAQALRRNGAQHAAVRRATTEAGRRRTFG